MVPGPASIGIARGVNAISDLVLSSSSINFFFIPLCLTKVPVKREKPELAMTIPPPIRRDSMDIPKKYNKWLPRKNETSKMMNT